MKLICLLIAMAMMPMAGQEPPSLDVSLAPGSLDMPVTFRTKEGDRVLVSIEGAMSVTSSILVGAKCHCDFPGTACQVTSKDVNPALYVAYKGSIRGRIFLVRTKPDKGTETRSVKMGVIEMFGASSSAMFPDMDWVIPTTNKQVYPGVWEIRPNGPLETGE